MAAAILRERAKFWKLELWPHYLRRCDDVLYRDPLAGLALTRPAPAFAARIAEANPGANGDVFDSLKRSGVGSQRAENKRLVASG